MDDNILADAIAQTWPDADCMERSETVELTLDEALAIMREGAEEDV